MNGEKEMTSDQKKVAEQIPKNIAYYTKLLKKEFAHSKHLRSNENIRAYISGLRKTAALKIKYGV